MKNPQLGEILSFLFFSCVSERGGKDVQGGNRVVTEQIIEK